MSGNPFDFTGRVALVTGCGSESGIGHACARLLAGLGAGVAVTATTERVEARAAELVAGGAAATAHVADLTVRDEAFALVAAVERAHGRIDVLVNAAGIAQTGIPAPDAAFADLTAVQWRRELDVNLMTAVHTSQAALPGMVRRRYGRIVMISSVTGPMVMAPRQAGYGASKGAMDGVMRSIALDYGRHGVTANSVAPGWIDTASSLGRRAGGGPLDADRPRRHGRGGRRRRGVPGLRGGRLRHRPGLRRGRRQHHPGAARDRPVR